MWGKQREIIGICGLYCGSCPNYLAPRLGDHETLDILARERGISPPALACDGCLSKNVAGECRECKHGFRTCARDHDVTWCLECTDFPCPRLESFRHMHKKNGVSHHDKVIEDLSFICTRGARAWLERKAVEFSCPDCGRSLYWYDLSCPACGRTVRQSVS